MRSSGSMQGFADAFTGRLKALAVAHDILTQTRWIGIGLSELLVAVLAPYRSADEERVKILGPAVLLPAHAVVPLSMALHELTTNAVKYGALSVPGGEVDIGWRVSEGPDHPVELLWTERGGPKVQRPKTKSPRNGSGFGTTLIDRVITYDLDGRTTIDFDPAGIRCTIAFPVRGQAGPPKAMPGLAIA
jgi:two-component sensor histidine kinase